MVVDVKRLENFYNTNFSLAYSPDGKYLAAADRSGRLSLFCISTLLRSNLTDSLPKNSVQAQVSTGPIYVLLTKDSYLICGCADGIVFVYSWPDLQKQKTKPLFSIDAAFNSNSEINALLSATHDTISMPSVYTAGGDGKIHLWDLETKKNIISLSGHENYVHCLSNGPGGTIISGSEDGIVKFWDNRTGERAIHTIKPYESECSRPNRGKWIGCVVADNDWMVCGGGPELGFWHLGSYSLVKPLETNNVDHRSALLHQDKIIACGDNYSLFHWNFKGDLVAKVPVVSPSIYDIKFNEFSEKYKVLCTCGNGSKINVFVNLGYSSVTLDTSV